MSLTDHEALKLAHQTLRQAEPAHVERNRATALAAKVVERLSPSRGVRISDNVWKCTLCEQLCIDEHRNYCPNCGRPLRWVGEGVQP